MMTRGVRVVVTFAVTAGLGLSVASAAAPQSRSPASAAEAALDEVVAAQMAEAGIMGLAAALVVDRRVAWMKGYGFAHYRRTRPFIALLNGGEVQGTRILDAGMAAEMLRFQFTDADHPENYPASEGNSGLFWRTKLNGTRIGHGGNDPGIQTEMFADLSREVGVILFSNTSLSGSDRRAFSAILEALWDHAESLRAADRSKVK